MTKYRTLLDKEIATLTVYGCSAENWKDVQVTEDFSPKFILNVHFSGKVNLGSFNKIFELEGGVRKHSGIYNCVLHNCIVGNDVFIDKVNNYIANYEIGEGAFIENVDLIITEAESSFGNGVKVNVLIESGGRELPIFDNLSAPLAYMMTFYRHKPEFVVQVNKMIFDYIESQLSDIGTIGKNAVLQNCGTIRNVRIGDFAKVNGTMMLQNGTIISNQSAPVEIGYGVQCTDFIINSGSSISESAIITRCFVGQGCLIGKQFSGIDSLFFANFQGLHGEAVSIFAGPYTVTHHKSTLMLTALFSFMNAGSGTNQSNHMYKLGPVHQGVTERGVKTSSNSYIMWPARIGAFTVVLGRHKGNPDISNLPFSYLIESDGEVSLMPGINLHSAGTIRDVQKWPKRDLRTDDTKLDPINFDFLSPYTVTKMLKGTELLKSLLLNMDATQSFVWYQNCKMKRSSIKKGIELYEMAVDQFVGNGLFEKFSNADFKTNEEVLNLFNSTSNVGIGEWIDLTGLLAPKTEIDNLISAVVNNKLSLSEIQNQLVEINEHYSEYTWNFSLDVLKQLRAESQSNLTLEEIVDVLNRATTAELTFNDMILRDCKKEFNSISKIGFGIDGDEEVRNVDFEATRGSFEANSFVKDIQNRSEELQNINLTLINRINKL